MARQGIVTLCDQNYFAGLLQLHASIWTSWPCPIHCYDIGLSDAQKIEAASIVGLTVSELPDDPLIAKLKEATRGAAPLAKQGKRIWPLWICPLLIRAAPFDEVFWLDCDILVLRGLDELFQRLAHGPVFTPENKAPEVTPNAPQLYDLLPIGRDFDQRIPTVNGGVSGWVRGRDDAALADYIRPIEAATHNPAIMEAISWHDQGALIWAIQNQGLESRVLESSLWNLCIDRVRLPGEILLWDDSLCHRLRLALPEVRLLHWNGSTPPWLAKSSRATDGACP
jgi:hypothetical protein